MAKKKAKPEPKIADKKKRGEWVELQFMAEAAEHDLPASKPLGDSENFDVVVGRPGKFVAVQVKCTVFRSKNGEGYVCSVCSSHKVYRVSGQLGTCCPAHADPWRVLGFDSAPLGIPVELV